MDRTLETTTLLTRAALCALALALPAAAQQGWPPQGGGNGGGWPPQGGGNPGGGGFPGMPGQAEDLVNLGALGLGVEVEGDRIRVRDVLEPSPAGEAGVREGDVIVGVAGRRLQDTTPGPALQVTLMVERAEASRKPIVELIVERGGEHVEIPVRLRRLGKHGRSCPEKCKKCDQVVREGLEFLVRTQNADGSFPTSLGGKTGMVVVTSLSGLALLSAGVDPEPDGPLGKAVTYVMNHVGKADRSPLGGMGGQGGNWNQINWELGYGLMFLAEVAHATRSREIRDKCRELVGIIERNQETSGGWAHGPGGPNALGYVELEIVGNYLLAGLAAARRLELELNEDRLAKALTWIEGTSPGDGGVGYSQRDGQRHGDAGRTAGALVAFHALGQAQHPFFEPMTQFYRRNLEKLPEGHVSPAMHLLAGAMAAHVLGRRVVDDYYDAFRLHIMQHRRPDGSFASTPTQESRSMRNNTDLTVGPRWTTATYVLILTLHEGNLPLLLGESDGKRSRRSTRKRTGS